MTNKISCLSNDLIKQCLFIADEEQGYNILSGE